MKREPQMSDYLQHDSYDKADKYSIEKYGQNMVGKTFYDLTVLDNDEKIYESMMEYNVSHENKKRKGGLGELVEERFFHYKANSDSDPDFKEAGVELKVSPYKINKNKSIAAKERLVLTMIDYNAVINEIDFDKSHFWYKSQWLLLVYYLWNKEIKDRLNYRIDYVRLFTPSNEDLAIIKNDYFKILKKVESGKAHELSESDTMYLSACTKSSDSSIVRKQPNSEIPAKPRAFAYKSSYMTYVLNNYIIHKKPAYESIISGKIVGDIENYILNRINQFKGKSVDFLCKEFEIALKNKEPKNLGAMLSFRMLNIKSNNAEEFMKANIKVKTFRINKKDKIKENISFPTFKFSDVVNQKWEESDFYNLLYSTKFLFVVYQEQEDGSYNLDHAQFWNMPYDILDSDVKSVWEKTKYTLLHLPSELKKENGCYKGIFPKQTENAVCHVRPHGRNSKDTYILPDGREYPKQCFWLNNSYILKIIKNHLD